MRASSPLCPRARISSGNGSPSAHTAPSSKYSFFQMGTVFFQRVDDPAAGLEGGAPVGRGNHDQHAGLANFQPAQPMDDGNSSHRETVSRLSAPGPPFASAPSPRRLRSPGTACGARGCCRARRLRKPRPRHPGAASIGRMTAAIDRLAEMRTPGDCSQASARRSRPPGHGTAAHRRQQADFVTRASARSGPEYS